MFKGERDVVGGGGGDAVHDGGEGARHGEGVGAVHKKSECRLQIAHTRRSMASPSSAHCGRSSNRFCRPCSLSMPPSLPLRTYPLGRCTYDVCKRGLPKSEPKEGTLRGFGADKGKEGGPKSQNLSRRHMYTVHN